MKTYKYKLDGVKHTIRCDNKSSLLFDKKGEPLVDQRHMSKMNKLFKSFIRFAKMNDINWICQGGTLLGAARDSKGFLYWDSDIDIIVFYKQAYEKLLKLVNIETDDGCILEPADVGFIYRKKGCDYPWVDVWVYEQKPNDERYIIAGPIVKKKATFILDIFWTKEYVYENEMTNAIDSQFESYTVRVPPNLKDVVKRHFSDNVLTHYIYDPTNEKAHLFSIENKFWKFMTLEKRKSCIDFLCSPQPTALDNRPFVDLNSVYRHNLNFIYIYCAWWVLFHGDYNKLNVLLDKTIDTSLIFNNTPKTIKKHIVKPLLLSISKEISILIDTLTL